MMSALSATRLRNLPNRGEEAVSKPRAFPPETIDRARALYEDRSVPLARILAETGLRAGDLYWLVDGAGGALRPLPRRTGATGRRRALSGDRSEVVKRIWRTAERQVRDIEERVLRNHEQPPDERANDARTLAVLIKALAGLAALDDPKDKPPDNTPNDDDGPRDIDEFRRELARKMDAFIAARTGPGVSDVSGE
jgi:hypothetical protein